MANSDGNDPDNGLPKGPSGGFGYGESGGDGAGRVTLSEAAQATEHVVEDCRRKLQLLRRRLKGKESRPRAQDDIEDEERNKPEDLPSPREQALTIATELEACAGALRNASTPEE